MRRCIGDETVSSVSREVYVGVCCFAVCSAMCWYRRFELGLETFDLASCGGIVPEVYSGGLSMRESPFMRCWSKVVLMVDTTDVEGETMM